MPEPTLADLTKLLALSVREDAGWLNAVTIREVWDQAPADDDVLSLLIGAALTQVKAYAPALPAGMPVPPAYLWAQLLQTKNLWNAGSASGEESGGGDFVLRPFPLDWQVKALLRPKRGVPVIG